MEKRRHLRDLFDWKRAKLAPGFVAPFAGFDLSNAVTPSNLGFNNLGNPRHSETCLCALVGHKRHTRQQLAPGASLGVGGTVALSSILVRVAKCGGYLRGGVR
jgi:hypothetical protein